jgi:tRNA wybutosine-synthesizing protein 1
MSQIPKQAESKFFNAGYRIIGSHSAVEICHWTKESLRKDRVCYKEKFYKKLHGIESHRCLEMTPSLIWCTHKCEFCWRPLQFTKSGEPKPDEPKEIVDRCVEARRLLLTGFGGFEKVDKKKLEKAMVPTNAAISLAGEPTLYSRISELLAEFHKRNMTTFLVSNGTRPDRLKEMSVEPTQLYISLCAYDEKNYKKIHSPLIKNGWSKLNESLQLMKSFDCKTAVRLTLVKGLNLKNPDKYARLIMKAEPDYCEVKAYFHVGESQKRLQRSNMPMMPEIKKFAAEIGDCTGYRMKDEDEQSRVVLLSKK